MAVIENVETWMGNAQEWVYDIQDKSDEYTARTWVVFANDYTLSIISEIKFGGMGVNADEYSYEIAVWGPDGNLVPNFFDGNDLSKGFVYIEELYEYAEKIIEL